MFFKVCLLVLVACTCARPNYKQRSHVSFSVPFIINGTDTTIEEHPHQASLQNFGSHSCGAVLTPNNRDTRITHLLTAAHCLDGADPADFSLLLGSTLRTGNDTRHAMHDYTLHPEWSALFLVNDLATIELTNAATASSRIATVNRGNTTAGDDIVITGWGFTDDTGPLPDVLQAADTKTISNPDCENNMGTPDLNPGIVCFFNRHSGACNGDSGGPAVKGTGASRVVVGLTSYGIVGCPADEYASAYTRVGHYESWISDNVSPRA